MEPIKELHTVALLNDIPEKSLLRGSVGTVVSDLSETIVEVEFVDESGKTVCLMALPKTELIRLRLETISA